MTPLARVLTENPVLDLCDRLARHHGLNRSAVTASLSGHATRAQWLQALQIRRFSIYLAVVATDIPQATLAHTLGLRRQTVHRICRIVEDARDDPKIDLILEDITTEISP